MKIQPINYSYSGSYSNNKMNNRRLSHFTSNDINFQGKAGAILGGSIALGTILATGGLAIPFVSAISTAAAAADAALIAGTAWVGSKAEDNINNKSR